MPIKKGGKKREKVWEFVSCNLVERERERLCVLWRKHMLIFVREMGRGGDILGDSEKLCGI